MNTPVERTPENKREVGTNPLGSRVHSKQTTFQFVDERPEAKTIRDIQAKADNSPKAKQFKAIQQKIYDSPSPLTTQLQSIRGNKNSSQQQINPQKENKTGLPDQLKSGIEKLSGHSMDDVKVHYNSDKPAQLQAHAYAQGTNIHLASGQEKHLPHEAWHVVQQKQNRVAPTIQTKGIAINNDKGLEQEADHMGAVALRLGQTEQPPADENPPMLKENQSSTGQLMVIQGQWEEIMMNLLYVGGTALIGGAIAAAYNWWPAGWSINQMRILAQSVAIRDLLTFTNLAWTPPNVIILAQQYANPATNPNNFDAANWLVIANSVAPNSPLDATNLAGIVGWNVASIQRLAGAFVGNPNGQTSAQWAATATLLPANAINEAQLFLQTPAWTNAEIHQLTADYVAQVPAPLYLRWRQIAIQTGPAALPIVPAIIAGWTSSRAST